MTPMQATTPDPYVTFAATWGPEMWGAEPDLCEVGNFTVTEHTVRTPNATYRLQGTRWDVIDRRGQERVTPWIAIVGALVLIPFTGFLSLLLLLCKDVRETGFVEVAASGPGFYESCQIRPTRGYVNMADLTSRVAYVRGLVARLG